MIERKEWNIQSVLNWTTQSFVEKEISSARLDAELLLSHVLGCRRIDLYLKFDLPMKDDELAKFRALIRRRHLYEPVAYILGRQEFYGRNFSVGPGVLIPRPESEHIIEEAKNWAKQQNEKADIKILDVATGSGCLAITLGKEISGVKVTALDLSEEALGYARKNIFDLDAEKEVTVVQADFESWALENQNQYNIVVCNPPYISKQEDLMLDVKNYEPALALYGGERGSELLLRWIMPMLKMVKLDGVLISEIGHDQSEAIENFLLQNNVTNFSFLKDYAGHKRVLKIKKG